MTTKEKANLMGKKVTVNHILIRIDNKEKRYWEPIKLNFPFPGWIVGFTVRRNGVFQNGYMTRGFDGYDIEPSYLSIKSTVPCVLVRKWVNSKPIEVPLDGFELGGEPHPPKQNWIEKARKWLSEESKNWPRDSKGRFIKEQKASIK